MSPLSHTPISGLGVATYELITWIKYIWLERYTKGAVLCNQGSQDRKIPGSPSGRYFSDFGSPKINLTSPPKEKKKKKLFFFKYRKSDRSLNVNQKYFRYTNQQIWKKEFYLTIYKVSAEFLRINLRQFMTHLKSCTSKINTVWAGLDNVYGNSIKP